MAYFEPRIYQAVNTGPLRFDIMKFYCMMFMLSGHSEYLLATAIILCHPDCCKKFL